MGDLFRSPPPATPKIEIPEELKPYFRRVGEVLPGLVGTIQPPYPEPTTPPPVPLQEMGAGSILDLLEQTALSGLYPTALAHQVATAAGAYLPGANPYIQQIMQGVWQEAELSRQQALADLRSRYARFGQAASSPLARAEADLNARIGAALSQQLGQLQLSAYEPERQRMMQAAQAGLALEPSLAQQAFSLGEALRNIPDVGTLRAMQEYARSQESFWRPFSFMSGVPTAAGVPQYAPSPIAGILGGIGSLLMAPLQGTLLGRIFK
jgi:hypothetical protein